MSTLTERINQVSKKVGLFKTEMGNTLGLNNPTFNEIREKVNKDLIPWKEGEEITYSYIVRNSQNSKVSINGANWIGMQSANWSTLQSRFDNLNLDPNVRYNLILINQWFNGVENSDLNTITVHIFPLASNKILRLINGGITSSYNSTKGYQTVFNWIPCYIKSIVADLTIERLEFVVVPLIL